jgi:sialic acid synthase SpsE|tara:strand:- start:2276 stop:3013 length:738 start_codon:yes stop_codon:yes gene_type:complete
MNICEVGLNHLGDDQLSWYYVTNLITAGCDAITYQVREDGFYKDKYENFELSFEHYKEISKYCEEHQVDFGIALGNTTLVDKFIDIGVKFFKVLSWDLTNYSYIDKLLSKDVPFSVSTGTSTDEVLEEFSIRYGDEYNISLIHTQLNYEPKNTNLKAIEKMQLEYPEFEISYGNHCSNLNMIYASIPFYPKDIWFYVKANNPSLKYPDSVHAVELRKVSNVIDSIKEIESGIGTGEKVKVEKKIR